MRHPEKQITRNKGIGQFLKLDQTSADASHLLGIHLEGSFWAKEYKGAMPEHLLRMPFLERIRAYQDYAKGNIRYITISPELKGVAGVISQLKELGIVAAIGHSGGADYEEGHGSHPCRRFVQHPYL